MKREVKSIAYFCDMCGEKFLKCTEDFVQRSCTFTLVFRHRRFEELYDAKIVHFCTDCQTKVVNKLYKFDSEE